MSDRLTRNELGWLLAQEARSAAQKLRVGVGMGPESIPPPPMLEEGSGGVEGTLNRLDEAVSMLASLHGQQARGRRGKIDLAALVWEVAPEARVQLEMGEGTTVFGDESELRRMLHVLLAHGGDPTSGSSGSASVSIRREGEEVLVGVPLGPDKPATFETERAWLARMATRYGGRLELDGSQHTLVLPADVDNHRRELDRLQKELAAAQAQGEAYARELAAVFSGDRASDGHGGTPVPTATRPSVMPVGADGLTVLVAAVRALGSELRGIMSAIGRDIAPLRDQKGEGGEIAASVGRHVTAASETVGDLTRLGACPLGELPRHASIGDLIKEIVHADAVRAARHDVKVVVDVPDGVEEAVPVGALTALCQALLGHAIAASPAGSQVTVAVTEESTSISITFDDAGPPLPAAARMGVFSREFEVVAHGRPAALPLIAAYAIASNLRLPLDIDEGPSGGARVRVQIPRSLPPL